MRSSKKYADGGPAIVIALGETSSSSYLRGGEGPNESGKAKVEKELVAENVLGDCQDLYTMGTDLASGKEEGRLEGLLEGPFLDVAAAMECKNHHLMQLRRRQII